MAKKAGIYLNHCGIAPLYKGALKAGQIFAKTHSRLGIGVITEYRDLLEQLHKAVGQFLHTNKKNISFIHNTAEGLSLIAQGFPFQKGDEIISYIHEYPSNHYPWRLQEKRGVRLVLLQNRDLSLNQAAKKAPCAWSIEELEKKINKRTRMLALSHVQFSSGFAADLSKLGRLCKERGVHLVIDAAQSLGAMPLFPERWNIDAVASSGWKWLLGPIGSGLLYTSPAFRQKLDFCMAGADLMQQGENYLDHTWKPYLDGRRFEYSTASYESAAQLLACFNEVFNRQGIGAIWTRIKELQKIFLDKLDPSLYLPLSFAPENSSAIVSLFLRENPDISGIKKKKMNKDIRRLSKSRLSFVVNQSLAKGLRISERAGYLRVGIHFYNSPKEASKAASILNHAALSSLMRE